MQFIIVTLDFFEDYDDYIEDEVCSTPKNVCFVSFGSPDIFSFKISPFIFCLSKNLLLFVTLPAEKIVLTKENLLVVFV